MPLAIPSATDAAVRKSLAKYGEALGEDLTRKTTDKLLGGLQSILNPQQVARVGSDLTVTEGETPGTVTSQINALLRRFGAPAELADEMNIDFKLDVATRVSRGAGRFVSDQSDVDEYPAWELHRIYDREVPRGFKKEKGVMVEIPDDDWPSRFADACEAAGDEDAAKVLQDTGRMVALISSGVWEELGNNRDDTLGNPFAPFAFNSGFGTDGVPYNECVELGLLDAGEKPEGTDFDFSKLFSMPEAA